MNELHCDLDIAPGQELTSNSSIPITQYTTLKITLRQQKIPHSLFHSKRNLLPIAKLNNQVWSQTKVFIVWKFPNKKESYKSIFIPR